LIAASQGRGRGATFTLELPTVPAPARPAAPPEPARSQLQTARGSADGTPIPLRILLAEDNADTLRIMSRLLRERGHRVASAGGVEAALRVADHDGPFDLVISDIGLPDGSGLELMRRIQAVGPVPGIALSGYGSEDDLRKSREAGFITHLTKPVDFPTLEAAIRLIAAERE
jgi:CheY-like chemotaxis protein